MNYVLAHDIGTSGDKACLVDQDFRIVSSALEQYPSHISKAGQVEQDPQDWWQAICKATHSLLVKTGVQAKEIACITFSGQMMGCLPVDRANNPLRLAMIWADQRAAKQADRLRQVFGGDEIAYRLTGQKVIASFTGAKILWIRENEPEIAKRTAKYTLCKDYIIGRLCGSWVTDPSDASGTNLYGLHEHAWLGDILESIGLNVDLLPEIRPSTDIVGHIQKEAAYEIGLLEGTPIVQGGADGECAAIGAGAAACGDAYLCLGTSGWIAGITPDPVIDPEMRFSTEAHVIPGLFSPNGTTQNCGSPYLWMRDMLSCFCPNLSFDEMDNLSSQSSPGANGLLFLPHLLGERSPFVNLSARAVFLGISQQTQMKDLLRSILEGTAFNFALISQALAENGVNYQELRATGGGTHSPIWMQIISDALNIPLSVPHHTDIVSSIGAAVCGGIGVGLWDDFRIARSLGLKATYQPDSQTAKLYQHLITLFGRAYTATTDINTALTQSM